MRFCAIIFSGTGRMSYDVNVYVILNTPTFWADTWTDSPSMCPSTESDGQFDGHNDGHYQTTDSPSV